MLISKFKIFQRSELEIAISHQKLIFYNYKNLHDFSSFIFKKEFNLNERRNCAVTNYDERIGFNSQDEE